MENSQHWTKTLPPTKKFLPPSRPLVGDRDQQRDSHLSIRHLSSSFHFSIPYSMSNDERFLSLIENRVEGLTKADDFNLKEEYVIP